MTSVWNNNVWYFRNSILRLQVAPSLYPLTMTNQIVQTLNGISADSFEKDGQRMEAVAAAYALVARLETPWDFVSRLAMGQPAFGAALKIALDVQLYQKWHEVGDGRWCKNSRRAARACATVRLVQHLPAYHVLEEASYSVFKPTALPISFNKPVFSEWINHHTPKTAGGKDMLHFYQENRVEGESFNQVMGGVMANQSGWLKIFPHDTLLSTAKPDGPLLVDIGGNIGHDLDRLFYSPRTLPHDWSDEPARKILEMQRDALTPGYSKLLIHDHIAPDTVAHPHTTAYDLTMMVMVAGEERSEVHWRALLKSAGYRIVKTWSSPLAVQKAIEAELDV
ncbi:hypothetical protein MGN70_012525 [Eutypa lata]|nr:hypothetical protein MGN70_012525 [Eutypa lata]